MRAGKQCEPPASARMIKTFNTIMANSRIIRENIYKVSATVRSKECEINPGTL